MRFGPEHIMSPNASGGKRAMVALARRTAVVLRRMRIDGKSFKKEAATA